MQENFNFNPLWDSSTLSQYLLKNIVIVITILIRFNLWFFPSSNRDPHYFAKKHFYPLQLHWLVKDCVIPKKLMLLPKAHVTHNILTHNYVIKRYCNKKILQ